MLVSLMRWTMAIVFLAGLLWLVFGVLRRPAAHGAQKQQRPEEDARLAEAEDVRT
jgi:hypothetical protein